MLKIIIFGTLLTIALIPTGSFAQEPVIISGPVEIKKESPPASRYEKLLETPGAIVISEKYPIPEKVRVRECCSLRLVARVSYRENTPRQKVYSLHHDGFSIDLEKVPVLLKGLRAFSDRMKVEEGNKGAELYFRYSDKYYLNFYSYTDEKGLFKQTLYANPGYFMGQGPEMRKQLDFYINSIADGYAKLQELKRAK